MAMVPAAKPSAEPLEAGPANLDQLGRMEPNRLAMLMFLLSEVVFFSALIIAYIYYSAPPGGPGAPAAKQHLDILYTAIFTLALFASSGTMILTDRALARGEDKMVRIWLAATVVLGATFLVGQGFEYYRLLNDQVTMASGLFGSTFFTLTGFHGFHVLGGLVLLSILLVLALFGQFKGQTHNAAISAISIYWHFVDIVWVFIFSIVYVWSWLA